MRGKIQPDVGLGSTQREGSRQPGVWVKAHTGQGGRGLVGQDRGKK